MATQTDVLDPQTLNLFYDPPGTLRLTVGEERSYQAVKLFRDAPLRCPGRYLTCRVQAVTHTRAEFGVTYWQVETDRGPRDFVVQSLSESCVWLSDTHLLLIDVDGNRFEIADRNALDEASRAQLDRVL